MRGQDGPEGAAPRPKLRRAAGYPGVCLARALCDFCMEMGGMYIVAIGWLYVVLMTALTAGSVVAGLFTFFAWGVAPVALLLWLTGGPARRRARALRQMADQPLHPDNGADPRRNQ